MKILHAITLVGPKSFGLGAVAGSLASEQILSGIDAAVWSLDDAQGAAAARETYGLENNRLRTFPHTGPGFLGFSRGLHIALCGPEGAGINVVHQHGIWTGVSLSVHRWRRCHDGITVVAPHGALAGWALRRSGWKKALALRAYEGANLETASCHHATSRLEVEDFRSFGFKGAIASVPNGVSEGWLASRGEGDRIRSRFGIPKDKRIVLFMGRLSPVKNLVALIEAFAGAGEAGRDWVLMLAGAPEFGYQSEVSEAVGRHSLEGRVRCVGMLRGQEKRDAYAAAELFVLPSIAEGFGMVVLEAIATGLPAITTTGAAWEVLRSEGCGWWVQPTVCGLGGALFEALGMSRSELADKGMRARAIAAERFSWAAVCAQLDELYKWLSKGGTMPSFVSLK